jgi:hypothetical protein
MNGPDWTAVVVALIAALQAAMITVVVWATKKVLPKIPRAGLPLLAVAIGVGIDTLAALFTGGTLNPVAGAALGTLAVWLREVKSTVQQHGAEP